MILNQAKLQSGNFHQVTWIECGGDAASSSSTAHRMMRSFDAVD